MAAAGPSNTNPPLMPPSFQHNDEIDKKTGVLRFSIRRQLAWLERSEKFVGLEDWRARKFIGKGAYGLCGLWDYQGKDQKVPKSLVVKQVGNDPLHIWGLKQESYFLHLLTSTKTDHVVKLYLGCHRGQGTGADLSIDPLPFGFLDFPPYDDIYNPGREVARIYMEYVEHGDVQSLSKHIHAQQNWKIPEEHLWRILHCFAKACAVLEYGSEEIYADPVAVDDTISWRPICHFDLKHSNVLVGGRDDEEHKRLEVFKLADFGLSRFAVEQAVRKDPNSDWVKGTQWRATENWMSPEQFYQAHPNRDISSATNIWGVAAVIRYLITNETSNATQSFMHQLDLNEPPTRIHGSAFRLFDSNCCPYSTLFINTLCRCLAFDPADRFMPRALMKITTDILAAYDGITPERANANIESLTKENQAAFNVLPPNLGLKLKAYFYMPGVTTQPLVEPFAGKSHPIYRTIQNDAGAPPDGVFKPCELEFPDIMQSTRPTAVKSKSSYPYQNLPDFSPVRPP